MPIKIREGVQPFAPASLGSDRRVRLFADCDTREHLTREIVRYLRGESGGRSVLIAGHRGSGKTTLALQSVLTAQDEHRGVGQRPLLVKLEAPTLLLPASSKDDGDNPAEQEMATLLRRVTVALCQAVVDETHRSFLQLAAVTPPGSHPTQRELIELGSRLHLDLEGAPTMASLRDLWYRAGLLGSRCLFGKAEAGAGFSEVLALFHTVEAFQVAGGRVDKTLGEQQQASRAESTDWNVLTNGRQLLNPLLGLLSGSLVGVSLLEDGGVLAASLGTLAALATATTLNFTTKRLVESSQSASLTFTPDTSVFALSRLLPRLVRQLRDIGLSPVFVVDELDKLDDIWMTMERLIRHLKYLVTEDAFFCFLADRSYFELLRQHINTRTYPEAQTWFTDRLFVVYQPAQLHTWLMSALELVDAPPGSAARERDEAQRELLSYALLCRARLHVQEIQRLLRELQDKDGRLTPGTPERLEIWRLEALYQAAVDAMLDDPRASTWLDREPAAVQMVQDSLYYVLDRWQSGDADLVIGPGALRTWLEARAPTGVDGAAAPAIRDDELSLLVDLAVGVAASLCAPGELLAPPRDLPPAVRAAIAAASPPLARVEGDRDGFRYRWLVDSHGRRVRDVVGADSTVDDALGLLAGVTDLLANGLEQRGLSLPILSDEAGYLPISIDWAEADRARLRLAEADAAAQLRRGDHERVRRAGASLRLRLGGLLDLLAAAALLSGLEPGIAPDVRLREGLRDLAPLFRQSADPAALTAIVAELAALRGADLRELEPLRHGSARIDAIAWLHTIRDALRALPGPLADPSAIHAATRQRVWQLMLQRSTSLLEGTSDTLRYSAADLVSSATDCFDGLLRGTSLMTHRGLAAWSQIYVRAVGLSPAPTPEGEVPAWVSVPAAAVLGLLPWALRLTEVLAADPDEQAEVPRATLDRWRRALRRRVQVSDSERPCVLVLLAGEPRAVSTWAIADSASALCLDVPAARALGHGVGLQPAVERAGLPFTHVMVIIGDRRAPESEVLPTMSDEDALLHVVGDVVMARLRGLPLIALFEPLAWRALNAAGTPRPSHKPVPGTFVEALALFSDAPVLKAAEPTPAPSSFASSPGATGAEGP